MITKPPRAWLGIAYVVGQFLLAAVLVLSMRIRGKHVVALTICGLGVATHLWAMATMRFAVRMRPEVRKGTALVTAGPYRWVRHPMYAGLMLLTAGACFAPLAWWKLVVFAMLAAVLDGKARYEEALLQRQFSNYRYYRETTQRFVPFLY